MVLDLELGFCVESISWQTGVPAWLRFHQYSNIQSFRQSLSRCHQYRKYQVTTWKVLKFLGRLRLTFTIRTLAAEQNKAAPNAPTSCGHQVQIVAKFRGEIVNDFCYLNNLNIPLFLFIYPKIVFNSTIKLRLKSL